MKYYLITLKDNQQVIASGEDVCIGDKYSIGDKEIDECLSSSEAEDISNAPPLYIKKIIAGLEGLPSISFSELNQIPETGAIRVVADVDKLANDVYPVDAEYKRKYKTNYDNFNTVWKEGFYASQELKDELTEKEVEQTAIDFAMHFISSSDNIQLYMPKEFDYLQGLLLEQGAKIFKEFQDRPKIFEIEIEMQEYDEGGFSPEREPSIENNQIKITKILKRL